jgi:short-subunit dehydrogenase
MAVDRRQLAGPSFWLSAEEVVDASLDGLRKRKLFVVPGWRYRVLTAVLSKLPVGLRLAVESKASKRRETQLANSVSSSSEIDLRNP